MAFSLLPPHPPNYFTFCRRWSFKTVESRSDVLFYKSFGTIFFWKNTQLLPWSHSLKSYTFRILQYWSWLFDNNYYLLFQSPVEWMTNILAFQILNSLSFRCLDWLTTHFKNLLIKFFISLTDFEWHFRLRIHIFYLGLWWKSGWQNVLSDLDSGMVKKLDLKYLGQPKFTFQGHSF